MKTVMPRMLICLCVFLAGSARSTEAVITGAATARDGVDIHYEAMGSGSPTLVFIHGWNCDRHYWSGQLSYFAEQHQVVAIDLAGHGESGLQRTEWTIGQFGADVASVADQLALDDVILVGHSMGGPVALEAARRWKAGSRRSSAPTRSLTCRSPFRRSNLTACLPQWRRIFGAQLRAWCEAVFF